MLGAFSGTILNKKLDNEQYLNNGNAYADEKYTTKTADKNPSLLFTTNESFAMDEPEKKLNKSEKKNSDEKSSRLGFIKKPKNKGMVELEMKETHYAATKSVLRFLFSNSSNINSKMHECQELLNRIMIAVCNKTISESYNSITESVNQLYVTDATSTIEDTISYLSKISLGTFVNYLLELLNKNNITSYYTKDQLKLICHGFGAGKMHKLDEETLSALREFDENTCGIIKKHISYYTKDQLRLICHVVKAGKVNMLNEEILSTLGEFDENTCQIIKEHISYYTRDQLKLICHAVKAGKVNMLNEEILSTLREFDENTCGIIKKYINFGCNLAMAIKLANCEVNRIEIPDHFLERIGCLQGADIR